MTRKRHTQSAEVASDKCVNMIWWEEEEAAKILELPEYLKQKETKCAETSTKRESPMFEIERDDMGNTVSDLILSLEEPTKREHLEEFVILSLSQEVENVVNLLRNQISMKDEKIKTLSSEVLVLVRGVDIWRNQSKDVSEKNDELTKKLEEASQTNNELATKLEVAKNELISVKSEKDERNLRILRIKEETIDCLNKEINLTREELSKANARSEKIQLLLTGFEEVRTEEAKRLQNRMHAVKKLRMTRQG